MKKFNKSVYIMVGIPGSGKSTLIKKQFKPTNTIIIESDAIREELYGDANIQGNNKDIFDIVFSRYRKTLQEKCNSTIIIDSTNLTYNIRKKYLDVAKEICFNEKYILLPSIVYFNPNLEMSIERNNNRDRKVPINVIERMFYTIEPLTEEELKQCYCYRAVDDKLQIY